MKTAAEWWQKWQASEQALARLNANLSNVSFVSSATILASVGHQKNATLALTMIENFAKRIDDREVPINNVGVNEAAELYIHRRLIGQ